MQQQWTNNKVNIAAILFTIHLQYDWNTIEIVESYIFRYKTVQLIAIYNTKQNSTIDYLHIQQYNAIWYDAK